jgi:hypothetical protein
VHHLIHVGYPKGGSNLLRAWFAAHPHILYAHRGIAGFVDAAGVARYSFAPPADHRLAVTSSETLAWPHANAGIDAGVKFRLSRPPIEAQARVCATLADVFPGAHVLLVTRAFRGMMVSGYSQYLRAGGDTEFLSLPGREAWVEHWNYDRMIRQYRTAFGDRLIVMPYELLRDEPDVFARALEERFGLDHHPMPRARLNPALSEAELRWYPLLSRLVSSLPLGARLRRRAERRYTRAAARGRLRHLARVLEAVGPSRPAVADLVTDAMVEPFRGRADALREIPFYERYQGDYLIDEPLETSL